MRTSKPGTRDIQLAAMRLWCGIAIQVSAIMTKKTTARRVDPQQAQSLVSGNLHLISAALSTALTQVRENADWNEHNLAAALQQRGLTLTAQDTKHIKRLTQAYQGRLDDIPNARAALIESLERKVS